MKFFRGSRRRRAPLQLVVAINKVDSLVPDGWDERLNAPTERAEQEIQRQAENIIRQLSGYASISRDHLEYYSAAKRYRLLNLLNRVVRHARAGFRFEDVVPLDPFGIADPDVQEFVAAERRKRTAVRSFEAESPRERLMQMMHNALSEEDFRLFQHQLEKEFETPPRIAVFGKAGVGKTTTINSLFNTDLRTSHTSIGTKESSEHSFSLPSGGEISLIDLPGYGYSLAEDKRNQEAYLDAAIKSDLVLIVMQANARDLRDDQEMVLRISGWLREQSEQL